MWLCRGKDELGMLRRFFESLQQRVEGVGREHVNFVDNKNFVAGAVWQVTDVLAQFTHIVDTGIRGAVYFYDIKALSGSDFRAGRTDSARLVGETFIAI